MAKDLNKVQVLGYLGADPELRYTQQGTAVTTFRVAASRTWTDAAGAQQEETEWFRVIAWEKLGKICNQYLQKGARVYVEGRLQTRKWQDTDGQAHAMTEVVAHDMIMLSSRNERPSRPDQESARPGAAAAATSDANPAGDAPITEAPAARGGGHAAPRARATEGAATPPPDDLPF
jgi:single-strand DNA-binding protein